MDAVTEVLRVSNAAIDPPSSMVAQGTSDYLRGIAKLTDRLIILLDLNKLLSSKVDADAIARVLGESRVEAKNQDTDTEVTAVKSNGNGKRKVGEVPGKNNGREYAVA